jgi:hypothetical protein
MGHIDLKESPSGNKQVSPTIIQHTMERTSKSFLYGMFGELSGFW